MAKNPNNTSGVLFTREAAVKQIHQVTREKAASSKQHSSDLAGLDQKNSRQCDND
jgi:hypothetical protein